MQTTATIPQPQLKKKRKFYMTVPEEIQLYWENKGIQAWVKIDYWLRFQNPHVDRALLYTPQDIAEKTKIPISSVYKALSKLKKLGRIKTKPGQIIVIPNDEILIAREKQKSQQKSKVVQFPQKNSRSKRKNSRPKRKSNAESYASTATQNRSDSSDSSDFREKEENSLSLEFPDPWLEPEETKQEDIYVNNEATKQAIEAFKQEQLNNTVEAEIITEQVEPVSTSDKQTTDLSLVNEVDREEKIVPTRTTLCKNYDTRWLKKRKPGESVENFLIDRPWLNDRGQLKRELVEWLANRYLKSERFKDVSDMADAVTIARNHLLNTIRNEESDGMPSEKLYGYWEDYQIYLKRRVNNAVDRERVGLLEDKEKQQLVIESLDLACKLNPDNSPVAQSRLEQQNNNSAAQLQQSTALVSHLQPTQQNGTLVENKNISETEKPIAQEEMRSDRQTINDNTNKSIALPTDEFGAVNNAEAYKSWQPKKDDNPATTEQMQALKEKLAKFRSNFGKGLKTEPKKSRSQLLNEKLDRLKRELQDDILRPNAIATAEKEGYELIKNKFGDVVGLDLPF